MKIEIKELRKKDYKKAIEFAITGMHFNRYLDSKALLKLYGTYFLYLELTRASQVIAAYMEGELVGVLLANIKGEQKKYGSFWKSLYVKIFVFLQNIFYKSGVNLYDKANKEMLLQYSKKNSPDGEIIFLAANPQIRVKGIGSKLLNELERRESGKKIYLFTDDGCTYQFYEHRGFERACEKDIVLDFGNKKVPIKCLLYSKVIE